jgi:hypothetical protein
LETFGGSPNHGKTSRNHDNIIRTIFPEDKFSKLQNSADFLLYNASNKRKQL